MKFKAIFNWRENLQTKLMWPHWNKINIQILTICVRYLKRHNYRVPYYFDGKIKLKIEDKTLYLNDKIMMVYHGKMFSDHISSVQFFLICQAKLE